MSEDMIHELGFEASVSLDFKNAIQGVEEFQASIENVNQVVSKLNQTAKDLLSGYNSVTTNVMKLIRNELARWSENQSSFKIEGQTLKKMLEQEIANTLTGLGIFITNKDLFEDVQITLSEAQINKLRKKLEAQLKKALKDKLEVKTDNIKFDKITLSDVFIKELKESIANQIGAIAAKNLVIKTKEGNEVIPVVIKPEQWKTVLGAFSDKFVEVLANPKMYKFENIPPVTVNTQKVKETLELMKKYIEGFDKSLEGMNLQSVVDDNKTLRENLLSFYKSLAKINKDIHTLAEYLRKNFGEFKNEDEVKLFKEINKTKVTIVQHLINYTSTLNNVIKEQPLGTINQAALTERIANIVLTVNSNLMNYLDELQKNVIASFSIKESKGTPVINLKKLEEAIRIATQESIKHIESMGVSLNEGVVLTVLEEWAESMSVLLAKNIKDYLSQITASYIVIDETLKNQLTGYIAEVLKSANINVSDSELKKILDKSYRNIMSKLEKGVKQELNAVVKSIDLDVGEVTYSTEIEMVKNQLKTRLERFVIDLANLVKEQMTGVSLSDEELNKLNNIVNKQIEEVVNYIITNSIKIIKGVTDGLDDIVYNNVSEKQKTLIVKQVDKMLKTIIKNLITALQYTLQSVVVTSETVNIVQKKLQDKLNKSITDINLDNLENLHAELDKTFLIAGERTISALQESLINWKPAVNLKLDVQQTIITPLRKALNKALKAIGERLYQDVIFTFFESELVRKPNPFKFQGYHGTIMKNWENIQKEGFARYVKPEYVLNKETLTSLNSLYISEEHPKTSKWFKGIAHFMPDYDAIVGVQGEFKNPLVLSTKKDLDDLMKQVGAEKYIPKRPRKLTDEAMKSFIEKYRQYLSGNEIFWEKVRSLGYDGIIIRELNGFLTGMSKYYHQIDSLSRAGKDVSALYEEVRKYKTANFDKYVLSELFGGDQLIALQPDKIKAIGLIDGFKKKFKKDFTDVNKLTYSEELKVGDIKTKINAEKLLTPIKESIEALTNSYVDRLLESIKAQATSSYGLVKTANLHPEARKSLARYLNTTVAELMQVFPTLEGDEALEIMMRENIKVIMAKFHEAVQSHATKAVMDYSKYLDEVKVEPDVSAINYMINRFDNLQKEIAKKVRELLKQQFDAMVEEVKAIKVYPYSIGYKMTKKVEESLTPSTTKKSLTSREYSFDAKTPVQRKPNYTTFLGERVTPGGDTHTFAGSILNTIRYITASQLFILPSLAMWESWSSTKEFDYELEKARQNFLMKDREMLKAAERMVQMRYEEAEKFKSRGISAEQYNNPEERRRLIKEQAEELKYMTREGVIEPLQNIAFAYGLNQQDVGKAWHISSRRLDNPWEALTLTKGISKLYAYEKESSPEDLAKGMEAILSQWQISGYDSEKLVNMLIKTASLSQATVSELIEIQKRTGAIFEQNMPGRSKEEAFATSLALSSLFIQSTARSGAEGGTFWRTIFLAPFLPQQAKYLEQKSAIPGFEKLSPYKKEKTADGTEVKRQKDGLEMFIDIMDSLKKMDDASQKELIKTVYKQWHTGSVTAINAMLEDLKKVSGYESLRDYIKDIQNVKPEEIAAAISDMMNTWQFKTQRVKTMWQISTFEVWESLKDEFSKLTTYLIAFLRGVRDNAEQISDLINLISKVAVFYLGKWAFSKIKPFIEKASSDNINKMSERIAYNRTRWYDRPEYNKLYNKAMNRADRDFYYHEWLYKKEVEPEIIRRQYAIVKSQLLELENKLQEKKAKLEEAKGAYNKTLSIEHTPSELNKRERFVNVYEKTVNRLQKEYDKLNNELIELDNRLKKVGEESNEAYNQMKKLDANTEVYLGTVQMLNSEFAGLDISFAKLITRLQLLQSILLTDDEEALKFDISLRNLLKDVGFLDSAITHITTSLEKLKTDFIEGKITARQFADELVKVQAAEKRLYEPVINTKVQEVNKNSASGFDFLSFLGLSTIFSKGFNVFKKLPELLNIKNISQAIISGSKGLFSGLASGSRKLAGTLFSSAKVLGSGLLAGVAAIPELLLGMLVWDVGLDALSARGLRDYEYMEVNAESKKRLADLAERMKGNWQEGNYLKLSFDTFLMLYRFLAEGTANLLGGAGASYSDYFKAITTMFSENESKDLSKKIQDKLGVYKQKVEAEKLRQQAELEKVGLDYDGDGLADTEKRDWSEVTSAEDGKQILEHINETLDRELKKLNVHFAVNKAKLVTSGYNEDSKELRTLMKKFVDDNIKVLSTAIDKIEEQKKKIEKAFPGTYENNEAWKVLNDEQMELKVKRAEEQEKQRQLKESELESITNKLEQARRLNKAEFDILRSEALLAGNTEDSTVVKQIQKRELEKENTLIANTILELNKLMRQFAKNDSMREKIWLQIKQLTAESKDNLVKIRQQLGDRSTFNLPSGIVPLTYWEAKTMANTHKNVTISQGGITVNVTIENMTGSTKDVQKVTNAISKTMREIQTGMTYLLNNQVKSGMANTIRLP